METIMKAAITGGIGSGKSYVCSLLKSRGIEVYDCDSAAKRIMRESPSVRKALTDLIGQDAYADGKPDKAVISKFLLDAEDNKKRINAIVHPAVADDFKASGLQFMECAILFESGFDKLVDCGTDRGEGGQNHRPRLYNAREGKRMDKLPDESGGDGG